MTNNSDKNNKHPTRYSLNLLGTAVYYWIAGQHNQGPWIVLTHGASLDHRMFDEQVTALENAGYRVLTWDMRGHGISKPMGDKFNVQIVTQDLLAILEEQKIEKLVLVGHSFGGYVSQEITFLQPERVIAMAVIGSTDITETPSFSKGLAFQSLPMILRLIPDKQLRKRYAQNMGVTPAVKEYALNATKMLTRDEFITAYGGAVKAICEDSGYGKEYHIPRPFLLTHGDADSVDGGTMAQKSSVWAKREPYSQYKVIPDAGHNANQDNSAFFNNVLLEFIERAMEGL